MFNICAQYIGQRISCKTIFISLDNFMFMFSNSKKISNTKKKFLIRVKVKKIAIRIVILYIDMVD